MDVEEDYDTDDGSAYRVVTDNDSRRAAASEAAAGPAADDEAAGTGGRGVPFVPGGPFAPPSAWDSAVEGEVPDKAPSGVGPREATAEEDAWEENLVEEEEAPAPSRKKPRRSSAAEAVPLCGGDDAVIDGHHP